jgi:hypothetical protein
MFISNLNHFKGGVFDDALHIHVGRACSGRQCVRKCRGRAGRDVGSPGNHRGPNDHGSVIDTQDTFTAGEVTFEVVNDAGSEFNHEFAIIAADSYEELPKLENGAVDEDALAEGQFLGRTEVLEPGQAETITFDLEPGTYLFICNINFGPNSHAANGQMLTATVNP